MADYLDLIQYGSLDLERSEELFKNQDYNFSAFCAQQGLEKHLKGYMIKFGIFENIKQLGHLQYPKIIEKMIEWMSLEVYESKGLYRKYLEKSIQFFEFIKKILEEINESYEKKIISWKDSLGITLNKQESNISNGIESELMKNVKELHDVISEFYRSDPFGLQNVDMSKLDEQQKIIFGKLMSIQGNLTDVTKSFDSDTFDTHQVMNGVEDLVEIIGYGSGKDSITKEETIEFVKFLKILKSFDWMWTVVESYPHNVIGRYPIQINGEDPMILYRENKENLWKFIQNIESVCSQIKKSCK